MPKRIEQDGKLFRVRRGVLVEIPPQLVGQTKRKRNTISRPTRKTKP